MSKDSLYTSGSITHPKEGTVIPKATGKGKGTSGFTFDVTGIIPYNVVIDDPTTGFQTVIPMTVEAIKKMQEANKTRPANQLMTYEEASIPGSVPIKEFSVAPRDEVEVPKEAAVEAPKAKKKKAPTPKVPEQEIERMEEADAAEHDRLDQFAKEDRGRYLDSLKAPIEPADIWDMTSAIESVAKRAMPALSTKEAPKIKVKLTGSFGSLTVPYNYVYRYENFLILIQYDCDEAFYEAPRNDQPLTVSWNDEYVQCLPGPQFPLGPGSKVMVTVFFIDDNLL